MNGAVDGSGICKIKVIGERVYLYLASLVLELVILDEDILAKRLLRNSALPNSGN